jgi:hypothetical protein
MILRNRRNELFFSALILLGGTTALVAQMDTGDDRSFAYRGYLEESGIPATTPHDIRFALFDAANADTSCLQAASLRRRTTSSP